MRPLTVKTWRTRFIDHLVMQHGARFTDARSAADEFCREHGANGHVWFWPLPEDEADFERVFLEGCDEHVHGLTPA